MNSMYLDVFSMVCPWLFNDLSLTPFCAENMFFPQHEVVGLRNSHPWAPSWSLHDLIFSVPLVMVRPGCGDCYLRPNESTLNSSHTRALELLHEEHYPHSPEPPTRRFFYELQWYLGLFELSQTWKCQTNTITYHVFNARSWNLLQNDPHDIPQLLLSHTEATDIDTFVKLLLLLWANRELRFVSPPPKSIRRKRMRARRLTFVWTLAGAVQGFPAGLKTLIWFAKPKKNIFTAGAFILLTTPM